MARREGPGLFSGVPTPPEPPPETPAPSQEERDWTWKRDQLVRLGVPQEEAILLADVRDSCALVRELLERGCPADVAARIVL